MTGRRHLELLAAFDAGGAPSGSTRRSTRWSCRNARATAWAATPTECASGSGSPPRCCVIRSCCCSTSRPPDWTAAGCADTRLLVKRLAGQGITIILSSHLLAEVEGVCKRVAIVRHGTIVDEGEIADLKRTAGMSYRLSTTDDERALAVCRAQPGIADALRDSGRITFTADDHAVAELSQALVEAGALIKALAPQSATLEDLFFSLTGIATTDTRRPPSRPRPWRACCDAERVDRVGVGADQAALPEAHLPRAGRGGDRPDHLRARHPLSAGPPGGDFAFSSYLTRSGLAVPLVILLFGAVWMFPLITALVAGDIIASEDHNGTLKTVLTRSLERWQIFAGKALAAVTYAIVAIIIDGTIAVVRGQHPVWL